MKWVFFLIVLYVFVVMQTALMPFVALHSIRPDLVILLAVHVALAAPLPDALLAAAVAGLSVDLCGLGFGDRANVGIHALAFGLTALLIVRIRGVIFRDNAATYFVMTFAATTLIHLLVGLHMLFVAGQMARMWTIAVTCIYTAAYTAFVSPYAHWFLRRTRAMLGIGPVRTLRVR